VLALLFFLFWFISSFISLINKISVIFLSKRKEVSSLFEPSKNTEVSKTLFVFPFESVDVK